MPALLIAFAALALGSARPNDEVDLKRVYKVNDTAAYSVTMTLPGAPSPESCAIKTTVTEVTADGAKIHFVATKMDGPVKQEDKLPDLISKVGPEGMPNEATVKTGEEFFIFLGAAGLVPNKTAKVGDTFNVKWQNDDQDVTFEGSGKLSAVDPAAKTATVDWDLKMTPSYTQGGQWTLKSVYSTDGFTLISSSGALKVGGTTIDVKIGKSAA